LHTECLLEVDEGKAIYTVKIPLIDYGRITDGCLGQGRSKLGKKKH